MPRLQTHVLIVKTVKEAGLFPMLSPMIQQITENDTECYRQRGHVIRAWPVGQRYDDDDDDDDDHLQHRRTSFPIGSSKVCFCSPTSYKAKRKNIHEYVAHSTLRRCGKRKLTTDIEWCLLDCGMSEVRCPGPGQTTFVVVGYGWRGGGWKLQELSLVSPHMVLHSYSWVFKASKEATGSGTVGR